MTLRRWAAKPDFRQAIVRIEAPGLDAQLYAEEVFRSANAFELVGAGWSPGSGAIRLRLAVQRQESVWHGVGRVTSGAARYQFAAVMTLATGLSLIRLSGEGSIRKTGEVVVLTVDAC
jgi:hypothetical protein